MFDSISTEFISAPNQSVPARIKGIRMQLCLSRKKFEEITGISANTLQSWEAGKNHLTEKGALKLSQALEVVGLTCTVEWLLNGDGIPPRVQSSATDCWQEDEKLLKEVMYFETNNPSPIVSIVMDDSMSPIYELGDYVAGSLRDGCEAEKLIGCNCIVTIDSGLTMIRKLNKGTNDQLNLYSINLDTNAENAFVLDCKIQRIAQVIWHRRTNKCPI